MKIYPAFFILLLLLLYSCQKEEKEKEDPLPYFHYSCVENGDLIDYSQFSDGKSKNNEPSYEMSDVFFISPTYESLDKSYRGYDNSMTLSSFDSGSSGNGIKLKWSWLIDSYAIEDGIKYFYDSLMIKKHPGIIPKFQLYTTSPQMGQQLDIEWGWMSFSRDVAEQIIILRVEFEADLLYHALDNPSDIADTIKYREGRIDFTTRMGGRIIGGDRFR